MTHTKWVEIYPFRRTNTKINGNHTAKRFHKVQNKRAPHKNTSPYCLIFPTHVHAFCHPNPPIVLSHHPSKHRRPTFPCQQDTQRPKQRGWNFFFHEKDKNQKKDPIFSIDHSSLYIMTNIRIMSNCLLYFLSF